MMFAYLVFFQSVLVVCLKTANNSKNSTKTVSFSPSVKLRVIGENKNKFEPLNDEATRDQPSHPLIRQGFLNIIVADQPKLDIKSTGYFKEQQ